MDAPITIRLGARARQRITQEGLQAADVAIVPAAAGGPKGLILHGIDTWLFGEWLANAPRERRLIGASIGAWRMAASALADPVAAHRRLAHHYTHQTYPAKVDAAYVTRNVRGILDEALGGHGGEALSNPWYRLSVITARGIGPLAQTRGVRWREMAGFLLAAAGNAVARARLARAMERVVFHDARDDSAWLRERFDPFGTQFAALSEDNLRVALLASGSIPLLLEAVTDIPGAPAGTYWDGGLIDYHLHLPYQRDAGLVLYPHFSDHIVPGWLDKSMPWRRARDAALDNVVLVAPSPSFLARLPNRKMPDRGDFKHYGQDHASRIRDWSFAIGESERLAEALARWVEKPDLKQAGGF
ncbi:patatin-like phospholipase family protein [Massilia sp. YMA4]|uniref:patatin-like phospholipase family protein n=1 Tax=Massilia sp. YMA4 TaxID=1593482 RepID=UPI000DD1390F|nr:patatin-like phospholipase family protein [Massilia sp. YMA4]AXA94405.1 patatin-like phospholipase family protein [Massilia sp. YMA4]